MAKIEKKKRHWIFPIALLIYAVLFLGATAYGLDQLWNYMDAYEQSRPHIALDAYMEKLSPDYVCDASSDLIAQIDHHIQSKENCRQIIREALSGGFTYAKKTGECTENRQVYVLRSGDQVIGTMEMERSGDTVHGFTAWVVTRDSFDLSFLLTEPITVTVPSDYPVYINGSLLGQEYITEHNIQYAELAEFYKDYSLPYMVAYEAGPFLGEPQLTVTDPETNEVTLNEPAGPSAFLNNCTENETTRLDTIVDAYIRSYVDFTSCTGNDSKANYHQLAQYMVPNGDLSKRMYAALDGLYWVSDRGAVLSAIDIHHYINIGGGRYMCDVTYVVDTRDYSGAVQTTSNVKIIFLETENGLKAETMTSY